MAWKQGGPGDVVRVERNGLLRARARKGAAVSAEASMRFSFPGSGQTAPTGQPELPQSEPDTTYVPSASGTRTVASGGDLQAAIDASVIDGRDILLDPLGTWTGNYTLPNPLVGGKINIRTDVSVASLPSRVTAANSGGLASVVTPNSLPAFTIPPGSSNWRLMGFEALVQAGVGTNFEVIKIGDLGSSQNSLALVPVGIVVDRIYGHGNTTGLMRRVISLHGRDCAVLGSTLTEAHDGSDAQAIFIVNTPGNLLLENLHVEASTENIMAGGADVTYGVNGLPSDITLRGIHFTKKQAWKGGSFSVKNHLEWKLGRRILVENCAFDQMFVGAQFHSIVMQSVNQGLTNPWAVVEHVTYRYLHIKDAPNGVNMLAAFSGGTNALPMNNILWEHILLEELGSGSSYGEGNGDTFSALDDIADLTIQNVTSAKVGRGPLYLGGGSKTKDRFKLKDSIMDGGTLGIYGDSHPNGVTALDTYAPGHDVAGNHFYDWPAGNPGQPAGNSYPTEAGVQFTDHANGDYTLQGGSPAAGKGCDISTLNSKLTGVR